MKKLFLGLILLILPVTVLADPVTLSGNNNLESLKIEGYNIEFNKDVTTYNLKINKEKKLDITYKTEDLNASVYINNNFNLANGDVIIISVAAESGAIKNYKINITKDVVVDVEEKKEINIDWNLVGYVGSALLITICLFIINYKGKKNKE